jgi:hypothetical protein
LKLKTKKSVLLNDNNQHKMKDLIDAMVNKFQLKDGLSIAKLKEIWEEIVGEHIAKNTVSIRLQNKKLLVEVSNAALKNELLYIKTPIKDRINKRMGREVVLEVVIL